MYLKSKTFWHVLLGVTVYFFFLPRMVLLPIYRLKSFSFFNIHECKCPHWQRHATNKHHKLSDVQPDAVFPLFATCCVVFYCARCQVVFSEIDVMHCQWAHFTLYQLSGWRISDWPVFSKLNFLSWRLSRTSCLYSAGITKQQPACVWQPVSIPTSFIQILQALGVDRLGNQCPQA